MERIEEEADVGAYGLRIAISGYASWKVLEVRSNWLIGNLATGQNTMRQFIGTIAPESALCINERRRSALVRPRIGKAMHRRVANVWGPAHVPLITPWPIHPAQELIGRWKTTARYPGVMSGRRQKSARQYCQSEECIGLSTVNFFYMTQPMNALKANDYGVGHTALTLDYLME